MTWHDGRPVYSRLPSRGYQDNPTVDHLTSWVDGELTAAAGALQAFWVNLDPFTAPEEYLDFLGSLCGMSGAYWDLKWDQIVKRQMISQSHKLWSSKGTLAAIRAVLDIHFSTYLYDELDRPLTAFNAYLTSGEVKYSIWLQGALTISFDISQVFGRDDLRLYVLVPLEFSRKSRQFKEAERTLRNYAPAVIQSKVTYERFYLGFSQLSEPLFSTLTPD
jgi:phage tail-like protein